MKHVKLAVAITALAAGLAGAPVAIGLVVEDITNHGRGAGAIAYGLSTIFLLALLFSYVFDSDESH